MKNILIILLVLSILIVLFLFLFSKDSYQYPYWDNMLNTSWNNSSPNWKWGKLDPIKNNKCARPT